MPKRLDEEIARRHNRHPMHGDVYTPITPEIRALLERMKAECGGTWRSVAERTSTKQRIIRRIRDTARRPDSAAVSLRLLDRLITKTGVGDLNDYEWFEAEDMVKLGIWKTNLVLMGKEQVRGYSGVDGDVREN